MDSVTVLFFISVTTGLQSIELSGNEIGCVFLPGSRADGCLLKWSLIDQSTVSGKVILNRNTGSKISMEILVRPGSYEVFGYGLLGNATLHDFPINLQEIVKVTSTGMYNVVVLLKGAYDVVVLRPELIEDQSSVTDMSKLDTRILVISISATVASSLVGFVILVFFVVAVVKCRQNVRRTMHEDKQGTIKDGSESIQTMPNICYEGILELDRGQSTPRQDDADNASLHLYDDIVSMFTVDYENVDPSAGFPGFKHSTCSQDCSEVINQSSPVFFQQQVPTNTRTTPSYQPEQHVNVPVQQCALGLPQHQHKQHASLNGPRMTSKHTKMGKQSLGSVNMAQSQLNNKPLGKAMVNPSVSVHGKPLGRAVVAPLCSKSLEGANVVVPSQLHSSVDSTPMRTQTKPASPSEGLIQQCRSLERVFVKTSTPLTETASKHQRKQQFRRASTLRPILESHQTSLKKGYSLKAVLPPGTTTDNLCNQLPIERACTLRPTPFKDVPRKHKKLLGRAETIKPAVQLQCKDNGRVSVFLKAADYEIPIKTTDV